MQMSLRRSPVPDPLSHPTDVDDTVGDVGQQLWRVELPEHPLRDQGTSFRSPP